MLVIEMLREMWVGRGAVVIAEIPDVLTLSNRVAKSAPCQLSRFSVMGTCAFPRPTSGSAVAAAF